MRFLTNIRVGLLELYQRVKGDFCQGRFSRKWCVFFCALLTEMNTTNNLSFQALKCMIFFCFVISKRGPKFLAKISIISSGSTLMKFLQNSWKKRLKIKLKGEITYDASKHHEMELFYYADHEMSAIKLVFRFKNRINVKF